MDSLINNSHKVFQNKSRYKWQHQRAQRKFRIFVLFYSCGFIGGVSIFCVHVTIWETEASDNNIHGCRLYFPSGCSVTAATFSCTTWPYHASQEAVEAWPLPLSWLGFCLWQPAEYNERNRCCWLLRGGQKVT